MSASLLRSFAIEGGSRENVLVTAGFDFIGA